MINNERVVDFNEVTHGKGRLGEDKSGSGRRAKNALFKKTKEVVKCKRKRDKL